MERPRHRVSAKIALLNTAGNKVLLTCLSDGGFGLPGGHVENDETPEQAIIRELAEELGIMYTGQLVRQDFWRDPRSERILLGFVGELDESTVLSPNPDEVTGVYWATLDDFDNEKVSTVTYEPFIRQVIDPAA